MGEADILRLLMITQGGQSGNFDKNLLKVISMVIYDSSDNKRSLDEIRKLIASKYELEFTNDEIKHAIRAKNSGIIEVEEIKQVVKNGMKFKERESYYSLDAKTMVKFKSNDENKKFDKIINDFGKQSQYSEIDYGTFKELLMRFLYNTFNTNKDTILLFLKGESIEVSEKNGNDYSEEEKALLNEFLNWDNKEKNEIIFLTASYCVEYCMLTVKKDFSSYKDIFRGKSFYLDSNVIFRLAGINNEERKIVTSSFIDKCVGQGITIKYTNFTYEEIKETVRKNVNAIKELACGKRLVSVRNWQRYTSPFTNLDFIRLYEGWVKRPGTIYNDYSAFQKYIMKNIDDILRSFKKVNFISYKTTESNFSSYCDNLYNFKSNKRAKCNNVSVEIDVNNYLYVFKLRSKAKGGTFVDIADYFISTDANLCEWGKKILPSSIPVAVLPSVWHSLILKFKGRTDNDYKAFSLFLNLRYRVTEDEFDKRKPQILALVQNLDEPADLKDMMLDDIAEKLSGEYNEISDINIIVEESKKSAIKKEAQRLYEKNGKNIKITAQEEGRAETLMKLAEHEADKKIKRNQRIMNGLEIAKVIMGIFAIVCLIFIVLNKGVGIIPKILQTQLWNYNIVDWISFGGFLFAIIVCLIVNPIKKALESRLEPEKIKEKEYAKLEQKMI